VTPAPPDLISSAWAGLLREQQAGTPTPADRALARARAQCRSARAEMLAGLAAVERADPAPAWLREWMGCLDGLLEVAERLHAHVETLPRGSTPTPI